MQRVGFAKLALFVVALAACVGADAPTDPAVPLDPGTTHRTIHNPARPGFGLNVNSLSDTEGTELPALLAQLHPATARFSVYGHCAVARWGTWTDPHVDSTVAHIRNAGVVPVAVIVQIPDWACNCSDPLGVPDTAAWRSMIHTIVTHLTARGVEYFEVGNEYNDPSQFHGSAADYDRLAAIAIDEIHAAGKIAIGPSTAQMDDEIPWTIARINANPGFDIVSIRAYTYGANAAEKVASLRAALGTSRPIWITEAAAVVPDIASADWVLNDMLARQPADQIVWWHLFVPGSTHSNLVNVDANFHVLSKSSLFYTFQSGYQVQVHSFWSPTTHIFTTASVEERGNALVLDARGKFSAYSTNIGGLTPAYRCVFHGDKKPRILALNRCPEGFLQENVAPIYMQTSQKDGWIPLYALSGPYGNGFYTTDRSEAMAGEGVGWSYAGILGYVRPPKTAPTDAVGAGPNPVAVAGNVAVHVAYSPHTHQYYTGDFIANVPAGYIADHEDQFVVNTRPIAGAVALLECLQGGTEYYRLATHACPAGYSTVRRLGYVYPVGTANVSADFVLTEFAGGLPGNRGPFYATADPIEKAALDTSSVWRRMGDIALVWF